MNIETIIRENYVAFTTIASLVSVFGPFVVIVAARALWRWVAGRRKKQTEPLRLREWQPSRAQREMYEHLRRTAFGAEPKPTPDRQYQGDQVTGIRKEVQELEARTKSIEDWIATELGNAFNQGVKESMLEMRVAALEGRDKPRGSHADANGWAKPAWMMRPNESMLRPDSPKAVNCDLGRAWDLMIAHPPCTHLAPEYRVFRSPSEHVFHVLRDGHEICHKYWGMWMGHPQGDPWVCGQFTDHGFTELHGPEKDAIVAEFLDWRAGQ